MSRQKAILALVALSLILIGASSLWIGCEKVWGPEAQRALEGNILKNNTYASGFKALYPKSLGQIANWDYRSREISYISEIGIAERYVLRMDVRVTVGEDFVAPLRFSAPTFQLNEVDSVDTSSGPRVKFRTTDGCPINFGPERWEELVRNQGNLRIFGIKEGAKPPVQTFGSAWLQGSIK